MIGKLIKDRDLIEKYSSIQYNLSKKILLWKHYNRKTVDEMAVILDMDRKIYLEYESGYRNHSINSYIKVLDELNRINETDVMN